MDSIALSLYSLPGSPIKLVPFLPDDVAHTQELERQRVLCGWGSASVDQWREEVRKGDKCLLWIFPLDNDATSYPIPSVEMYSLRNEIGPPAPSSTFTPLGHASLDYVDYRGDTTLANREDSRATIATIYILKSQQNKKLGRAVMDQLEHLAFSPLFSVKELTLNTFSANFEESASFWKSLGVKFDPTALVMEEWYSRIGYTAYKRESRVVEKDSKGEPIIVGAVFMRKFRDLIERN